MESSEHDMSEAESSISSVKRIGGGRPRFMANWIIETKFPDEKSAMDHLMAEEIWSADPHRRYPVQGGRKVHFRCNRMKISGAPCSILKCLFFPRDSEEVLLYKTNAKHSHDKNSPPARNIYRRRQLPIGAIKKHFRRPMETMLKIRIRKLIKHIQSPREIMIKLESEGFEMKHREVQIRNYCASIRRQKNPGKWKFEKLFSQIDEAKLYLKQQKLWNYNFQNSSNVGMTFHYRCKLVPKVGPQCAARKRFTFNKYTKEVTLYQKNCQHTHMDITKMSHLDLTTKTNWLLKQLHKCNRNALKEQGFRVLDGVGLQDCLTDPDDYSTSFHEQLLMLQQEPCTSFDYQVKEEPITDDDDFTVIPVEVNLYEGNDGNNETPKRKKKKNSKWKTRKPFFAPNWLLEEKFANEQLAIDHLAKDDVWSIDPRRVYPVTGGHKVHYRCNLVKMIGPQCAAWKCLLYSEGSEEVSLYKKDSDHTHNSIAVQFRKSKTAIKRRRLKEKRMLANRHLFGGTAGAISLIKRKRGRPFKNAPKIIVKEENINDQVENGSSDHHISQDSHAASMEFFTGDDSAQYVINYIGDDKISQDVNVTTPVADFTPDRKTNWLLKKSFDTIGEARAYLRQTQWSTVSNAISGGLRKTYFRCNLLKKFGPQCAARASIVYSTEANKVLFYQNMVEHTHDQQIKDGLAIPARGLNYSRQPNQEREIVMPIHSENSTELITCDAPSDNQFMDLQVDNDNDVSDRSVEWSLDDKISRKDMVPSYLNYQNTWRCKPQKRKSSKVYYNCSREECEAEMCLFYQMDSDEVLVYRKDIHTHEIIYRTENFPLHFNGARLIPDSYSDSNIIVKEELIINDEPVATTHNESDAIDSDNLSDDDDEQMATAQKWSFENKFANMEKASEFLATSNGLWEIKSTTKRKSFYHCTYPCEPQCPAHIFLLIEKGCNEVLYFSGDPHVHPITNEIGQSSSPIIEEIIIDDSDTEAPKSESPTVPTMHFKINVNDGETTEVLQPTNSTDYIEEILISDDSDKDSLNGDDVESTRGEWTFETKFDDYKTAKHYMKNLNLISFKSNISKCGVKEYYNCNLVVSDVEHCPSSKYLLYEDVNSDILLYNRNIQHVSVCSNIIPPLVPIQNKATNIIDLVDSDDDIEADKGPNTIVVNLEDNEVTPSTPQQNISLNIEKKWILEREFPTAQAATEYLKEEQIWSFQARSRSNDGLKEFYRCNMAPISGQQCAAGKYIHIKYVYKYTITNAIYLYKTELNHTHDTKTRIAQAHQLYDTLDEATKEMIKKLVKVDQLPKQITARLPLKFDIESEKRLCLWISKMRRNLRTKIISSLDTTVFIKTVENWFSQHTEIPDNEHEYFCVGFSINHDDKTFRCFLSTRRLLKNAVDSNLVHLDSTGSFHWQKNPITIVGTTDLDQQFHLFGIAICSNKYDLDYEFIFSSIQKGVHKCHRKVFKPECLITDDNEAVRKAFIKTFGNSSKIGICSKVALTNIFLKLSACSDSDLEKNQIREDILKLQKLSSQNLFSKAVELFFQKWLSRARVKLDEFLTYFKTNWIDRNSNWFQGFRPFTPISNKALLAEYDALMKNYKYKQHLPTQSFRYHIQIDLQERSRSYLLGNTFYKPTVHKPTIPMSVYEKAIAWNNLEKQIEIVNRGSEIIYYISSDDEKMINEEKLHKYRTCEHETLDDFFNIQFGFYSVRHLLNNDSLTCTCSNFMENYVCEHSVGMASVLNLIEFPPKMDLRQLNKNHNNAAIVSYINKA